MSARAARARAFRRWVLDVPEGLAPPPVAEAAAVARGLADKPRLVRAARETFGREAARRIWIGQGLPRAAAMHPDADPAQPHPAEPHPAEPDPARLALPAPLAPGAGR